MSSLATPRYRAIAPLLAPPGIAARTQPYRCGGAMALPLPRRDLLLLRQLRRYRRQTGVNAAIDAAPAEEL